MHTFVPLSSEFPGLRGLYIHAVDAEHRALMAALSRRDFTVYVLEGSRITDEASLFSEAAKVLGFPAYFGHNWDAFADAITDMRLPKVPKVAIIWKDTEESFAADAQVFADAVIVLWQWTEYINHWTKSKHARAEVFLLGGGCGFKVRIQPE